jgi:hypothetical protein
VLVTRIPERSGALVLRGDPGIGKTALLAAASAGASSKGASVLRTAGLNLGGKPAPCISAAWCPEDRYIG